MVGGEALGGFQGLFEEGCRVRGRLLGPTPLSLSLCSQAPCLGG